LDPDSSIILEFIAYALFLLLTALAAAAETALTAVNRVRLKGMLDRGVRRAEAILALLNDPRRSLSTLLLLDSLGLIGGASAATLLALHSQTGWGRVTAAGAGLLGLVLAEFIPKAIAARRPEGVALFVVGPIDALATVLAPALWLVNRALQIAGPAPGDKSGEGLLMREQELRMMVDVGAEEGLIDSGEKEMITGIFELGETLAREVMVPRIDMVAIEVNTPLREALEVVVECGHSRIPVYAETIDHIVGVLYAKDLLRCQLDDGSRALRDLLRPAYFIPESKRVDELLQELQHRRVHIAIVVDEYGGTAGIVTIEDLLEEIVGEIQDEYDFEEPLSETISEREFIFDARANLDDVNDQLGLNLPTEDSDTLGGLIYSQLGRVAVVGDEVHIDGARLVVLTLVGRRIKKVKIIKDVIPRAEGRRQKAESSSEEDAEKDHAANHGRNDGWGEWYQLG
jgi:CBS domain containing-hemolysin-like protein